MRDEDGMDYGSPRAGCLLALAFCCFFWAGVIVLIWGWPW
jgi:hypothetical protein